MRLGGLILFNFLVVVLVFAFVGGLWVIVSVIWAFDCGVDCCLCFVFDCGLMCIWVCGGSCCMRL